MAEDVPSQGHRIWLFSYVAWLTGVTAEDNIPGSLESGIGHKSMALEGYIPALPGASVVGGG